MVQCAMISQQYQYRNACRCVNQLTCSVKINPTKKNLTQMQERRNLTNQMNQTVQKRYWHISPHLGKIRPDPTAFEVHCKVKLHNAKKKLHSPFIPACSLRTSLAEVVTSPARTQNLLNVLTYCRVQGRLTICRPALQAGKNSYNHTCSLFTKYVFFFCQTMVD